MLNKLKSQRMYVNFFNFKVCLLLCLQICDFRSFKYNPIRENNR